MHQKIHKNGKQKTIKSFLLGFHRFFHLFFNKKIEKRINLIKGTDTALDAQIGLTHTLTLLTLLNKNGFSTSFRQH